MLFSPAGIYMYTRGFAANAFVDLGEMYRPFMANENSASTRSR